ncbi:MAG: type methionyl aminopeptidase [Bacteroidota bacterium]|jgi:methionyl aminopeptidase
MVPIRTESEIDLIRHSSLLVAKTHGEISNWIEPGVSLKKLDTIAEEFIRSSGGVPAFKGYHGFPNTLCISLNDVVVHGIPSDYTLKDGDIVSVDCGVKMNDYFGDSAYTYAVGEISPSAFQLMRKTLECLEQGILAAIDGNRVGDIGFAVQQCAEKAGFGVVRELVGHGVGKNLHEKPEVPNYGKRGSGIILKEGMVLAIEPMINQGTARIKQHRDGWTISTADKKLSAHYEHTVVVRKGKAEILSSFDFINKNKRI